MAKHVNAVVIGSGAGGGVVAKELATAGLSVLLLERGRWVSAFENRKDDLKNQRTSVLGAAFGPDEDRNPRVAVDPDGRETVVYPSESRYCNNAACVGGGTTSYGAMAWRFMEKDFRMRSTYGAPENSTLEDWPVSYQDLEPFYDRAEYEIGVSGDLAGDPFKAPRRRDLPMPALPPTREQEILQAAALRLKLHPFGIPMVRNTIPRDGRPPCMRCRWCVGFACELEAKGGTQNTVIPKAIATGNCRLETQAMVKEVLLDAAGKAKGVAYFDSSDHLVEQSADLVVVSCGATESARLLLNSKSKLFPNGIGNRHDWVGRNLQGHTYTGANGFFEKEAYDDLGPGAGIAICDYNHGNPGLRGGAMLANEFIRLPIQFVPQTPPGTPKWGPGHKAFMRKEYLRTIRVMGPTQDMPVFDSRVQVHSTVRDYWGIPVVRLSGYRHPHTLEISRVMADKAEQWLKEAGAVLTVKTLAGAAGPSGGQHQAGTCRMGNDPKTSVVDAYCRVHDVPNMFVIDASVHVTNGGFNPVLTIFALAYRSAAHIVKARKGNGLS